MLLYLDFNFTIWSTSYINNGTTAAVITDVQRDGTPTTTVSMHLMTWMSGMEISCNVISKSCLFPTGPTKVFNEIKLKFANSIFAQNDTERL